MQSFEQAGLETIERNLLAELEGKIERGLQTFYEVGTALAEIRDSRLYREGYATFEDYCRDLWGMSRRYANQLVAASEVMDNLGAMAPKPATEIATSIVTARFQPLQKNITFAIYISNTKSYIFAASVSLREITGSST